MPGPDSRRKSVRLPPSPAPGPLRARLFASVTAGFAPAVTPAASGLAGPRAAGRSGRPGAS